MLGRYLFAIRSNAFRPRPFTALRMSSTQNSQHNQAIIDLLQRHKTEEEQKEDPNYFKIHAFGNAIQTIRKVEQPIRLGNDILELRGIGPGIMARINEFLYAEEAMESKDPTIYDELAKSRALVMLREVPGIGLMTAKKLVAAGCLSIADLKSQNLSSILTPKQVAKVKYMGHLEHPVDRQDAEYVLNFFRGSLDSSYEAVLVGDYRRGACSFSGIHIMISHPDFVHVPIPTNPSPYGPPLTKAKAAKRPKRTKKDETPPSLLNTTIIPSLLQRGLIAETLNTELKSWEGVVRLPDLNGEWGTRTDRLSAIENVEGKFRRLYIHFVPQKSRGSYLITLTGDSAFEKDICYRAKQLGMLFNEYGLWKWNTSDPPRAPTSETETEMALDSLDRGYWSLVKSDTEEDIFAELGVDFIDPTRRNYLFLSVKARKKRTTSTYH